MIYSAISGMKYFKLPMVDGGLGVGGLQFFNEALCGQWLRRFIEANLWRRVICIEYDGEGSGCHPSRSNGPCGLNI